MAWNEPGGGPGDKDPWGRKRDSRPPDLDRLIRDIQTKLRGLFGRRGPRRPKGPATQIGVALVVLLALVLWLFSGFYVVQQGQVAVVLRFGQRVADAGPGAHWHFPFPIERREIVDVDKVRSVDIGYRRNEKTLGVTKVPREALMLTGDGNIAEVQFAVQYRVKNANDYLFNVSEPEMVIAQAAESAIRQIVGQNTLDYALTTGRSDVEKSVAQQTQDLLDRYQAGIQVVSVDMQPSNPPDQVRSAFEDTQKAREEARRTKNEAKAYADDVIPKAKGAAARILDEAQAYKDSTVARAEGDANRFDEIVTEYLKAPAVTRERMYIETMQQILSSTTKVFVDQKGNHTLYLPLDKMVPPPVPPAKPPAVETAQPAAPTAQEPVRERGRGRERERELRRRGVEP